MIDGDPTRAGQPFTSRPVIAEESIQPPPSETKLTELLDAHSIAAFRNGRILERGDPGNFDRDLLAARSSLESLYRDILLENAELRRRSSLPSLVQEKELARLRSLQLTEEERQFITDGLLLHAPGWRIPEALSEKLRISSKATSEEL